MADKPGVFVSRKLPEAAVEILRRECEVEVNERDVQLSKKQLLSKLRGRQGLVCLLMDAIDDEVLATPGLKAVSNVAVGYNNIDVEAATRRGVLIANTPGVLTETTADFAFCLMLAAARRVGEGERMIRSGRFKGWQLHMLLGHDVHGKTLGLVGFGRIGQAVARRAKGFGMRVVFYETQPVPEALSLELGAESVSLDALLRSSDFVSLHVPLLEETRHLIGEARLRLMKPTAILVNTSRGPVVDERALVRALKERRIAGAGLDVYENEPRLAPGLKNLPNAVLAPHIASATHETRARMACLAAENVAAALCGRKPPTPVNPEVLAARSS